MPNIDICSFPDSGLYLLLPDGERIVLTRSAIEEKTRALLDGPNAIPARIRAASDYQLCDTCPERDTSEICHAIIPSLAFFDNIDRFRSHSHVVAVYRDEDNDTLIISETTMQAALQFVTILSVTDYCELGQQYGRFFKGVNPLMPINMIGRAVFLNILHELRGSVEKMQTMIARMSEDLLNAAKCQIKRISLISSRDAFQNAFVNTELITHFVQFELEDYIATNTAPNAPQPPESH